MFSIIRNEDRSSTENEECGGGAIVSEEGGKSVTYWLGQTIGRQSSTWLLTFLLELRSKCGKREDTELSQLKSHSLQLFRNEKPKLLCEC